MLRSYAGTDDRVQGETPVPPGAERNLLVVMQPRAGRGFFIARNKEEKDEKIQSFRQGGQTEQYWDRVDSLWEILGITWKGDSS